MPIAWATGADVHVKELDATYLHCLHKIRSVMARWYPDLPFSTGIEVGNVVRNHYSNKEFGLLFSGGLDSTVTYYRHKDKNPKLIMIWGADIRLDRERFWEKIKKRYEIFADKENVGIYFIKANMRQFMNEKLLNLKFGKYLADFSWWSGIHHGIGLLGLCAPLSVSRNMGTIFIASSHTKEFLNYPWGSHPLIDNNVSWADMTVFHDGYELNRQEKIQCMKHHLTKCNTNYPFVRVCWSQSDILNCGECEKCSRTIAGLVLENIDPSKCGFKINNDFFIRLKKNFLGNIYDLSLDRVLFWKDIQNAISKPLHHNLYDSKDFFNWFKDFEILPVQKKDLIPIRDHVLKSFYIMPHCVQKAILQLPFSNLLKSYLLK
jgi:hypothetical protein